jgi:hypothetical protein
MSAEQARLVLLVRAVEETDREGVLLPARARAAATRRALDAVAGGGEPSGTADAKAVLLARAAACRDETAERVPALARLLAPPPLRALAPLVLGVALIAGGAANLLGPERHVSILAFPLAGILAWNLLVYLALLVRVASWSRLRRLPTPGQLGSIGPWLEHRRLDRLGRRVGRDARSAAADEAVVRFHRLWLPRAAPLLAARTRALFHAGALALALGAIAGMYAAGVAVEFRATWESTWLGPGTVQRYVNVVLGPAALVLDRPVPPVAPLRAPGTGSAAPWVHLWATTLALLVVVPRGLLAAFAALRAQAYRRRLPLDIDEGYYRRALAAGRGQAVTVTIAYYSCELPAATRDRLRALLQDLVGARATIRDGPQLAYGDEADALVATGEKEPGALLVLVFPLAQTPEAEVHGELLERLQERSSRTGARLMVVLETAQYRRRTGSEERLQERRAAWDRLLRELHLRAVELDEPAAPGTGAADRWIDAARRGIWPAESMAAAGAP